MSLVRLTAAVILLVVLQSHVADAGCGGGREVCDWTPWEDWGPCDKTCGGDHKRTRKLCCKAGDSFTLCASKCGVHESGLRDTAPCSLQCVFGYSSGGRCVCNARAYGKCCQYTRVRCVDNPCTNGGTCVESSDRYICHCRYGWSGPNCNVGSSIKTTPKPSSSSSFGNIVGTVLGVLGVIFLVIIGLFCYCWCRSD